MSWRHLCGIRLLTLGKDASRATSITSLWSVIWSKNWERYWMRSSKGLCLLRGPGYPRSGGARAPRGKFYSTSCSTSRKHLQKAHELSEILLQRRCLKRTTRRLCVFRSRGSGYLLTGVTDLLQCWEELRLTGRGERVFCLWDPSGLWRREERDRISFLGKCFQMCTLHRDQSNTCYSG